MVKRLALLAACATAIFGASTASAARLVPHSSGYTSITAVTAPVGDGRLFVVDQSGRIWVIPAGQTQRNATPYLDLTDRVLWSDERGLLGLAFHPNFSRNGRLFVNYVNRLGQTVVAQFRAPSPGANRVSRSSYRRLIRVTQPYSNHNGGNLAFGPDGFLYIGLGDGGGPGDPGNRAQNLRTVFGKMLRIDVNGRQGRLPYRIPRTNPFLKYRRIPNAIYSLGLRNPWRFSFDRKRGDMWIGDVGESAFEEINFTPRGRARAANFGWRRFEGRSRYSSTPLSLGRLVHPVSTYGHSIGCSVTGGFVYRGPSIPGLNAQYLFSDFCSSRIWALRAGPTPGRRRDLTSRLGIRLPQFGVRTFGEGGNGTLYVATGDSIWRFAV